MAKRAENKITTTKYGALRGWLSSHPFFQILLLSILLCCIIEMITRRSPVRALIYIYEYPLLFAFNILILLTWVSFSLLFRKRTFVFSLLASVWLALGLVDGILLCFRLTPLALIDFKLLESVKSIFSRYLSPFQIILIAAAAALLIAALVLFYIKSKKYPVNVKRALLCIVPLFVLTVVGVNILCTNRKVGEDFANIQDAYKKYGFTCSFFVSAADTGIDKPTTYSPYTIEQIRQLLEDVPDTQPQVKPNIIMLQLESFYDIRNLMNISVSSDPIPTFTKLKKTCSTGYLNVPVVGAGTANTEFEVITGMNIDYFGAGEYPYKTVLQSETCETVNYDLKKLGYTCHALHNNSGTFYDRNTVFPRLGFDSFVPIEYMQDVTFNPTGWANVEVLTSQICNILDSTQEQDFIYAISVQGHGKYPTEQLEGFAPEFPVQGFEDERQRHAFEYFLSQLNAMDTFISELIAVLQERNEPVILALYGDHLPNFDFQADQLDDDKRFDTEYVIWSNIGLEKVDRDVSSYQLASVVMERAGLCVGALTKLHQTQSGNPEYQNMMELMEYDMLYGEMVLYARRNPYVPTDMILGVGQIIIDKVYRDGNYFFVSGEGFTKWSTICINGKSRDTVFLNEHTLSVSGQAPEPGDEAIVAQIGEDGVWLSQTEPYIVP